MHASSRSSRFRALLLAASLGIAAFVAAGCVSTAPLVNPAPIAAAATPAQTRTAILRTLIQSKWTVESERPGEIIAKLGSSGWSMVIAIDYADQVSMHYVGSENLDYDASKGAPVIHPGYNNRTQRLADLIGTEIALMRASNDLAPVAAPPPDETPAE